MGRDAVPALSMEVVLSNSKPDVGQQQLRLLVDPLGEIYENGRKSEIHVG